VLTFAAELTRHELGAAALPSSVLAPVGVIALIVFTAIHLSVIAHEGAHALAGRSVGRRVDWVELKSNATGETKTLGPDSGPGRIFTSFAGYLGPSFFGLGAASLIALGYTGAVLVLALLLLVLMLFLVRNFFGVISVLLNCALLVVFLGHASARMQGIAAHGLSWLLLLSGVGHVLMHGSNAGDAGNLRRMTHIPRVVWSLLWLILTVAALAAGARMLT
jgi:hypothetical protein